MTATPKALLRALEARDGRVFAWCGGTGDDLTPQHRANRQMGGRRSAHRIENLVWLHADENWAIENEATSAAEARADGIKVSSHTDPALVPVRHAVHGLVFLTDDGQVTPVDAES